MRGEPLERRKMPFLNLDKVLTEFSCGAIRTQELLNRGFMDRLDLWKQAAGTMRPEFSPLNKDTVPSTQLVRSYEVAATTAVSIAEDTVFKITVLPVNLAYSLQHRVRAENFTRIRIYVEQVPIATTIKERENVG